MNGDYHNVNDRDKPNQIEDDEPNETMHEFDAVQSQEFESRPSLKTHQKPDRGHLYHDPYFVVRQVQGAALGQGPQVHHLDYIVLNRSA